MSETEDHNPELSAYIVSHEIHSESGDSWIGLCDKGWVIVWKHRTIGYRPTRMTARKLIRQFKENPELADVMEVHDS